MGGGLGHVAKLAACARPLAAMGHESWLASRDVVSPQALPDAPFARVLQAPLWVRGRKPGPTFSYGQVIASGGFADDDGLSALVRAWLELFEMVQPAGLYGSHAPASLLAAHVARLPVVRLVTPFTRAPAGVSLMPWVRKWQPGDDAVADRVVRAVCRRFGAPVLSGLAELLASAPPFLLSWPELHQGPPQPDGNYYGPLAGPGGAATVDWPSGEGPRVLVYLPFGRPQALPLVKALAQRRWPVVWLSESNFEGRLSANICHEAEPVAMLAALEGAVEGGGIFVTRGGHGSALEAIQAGCPMLVLPDTLETERNARALAAAGLGRRVTELEETAIGAALDALARADAPERAAASAARARHDGHDATAAALLVARRAARALRLL